MPRLLINTGLNRIDCNCVITLTLPNASYYYEDSIIKSCSTVLFYYLFSVPANLCCEG